MPQLSKASHHAIRYLLAQQERERNQVILDCAETDGIDASTHRIDLATGQWLPILDEETAIASAVPAP